MCVRVWLPSDAAEEGESASFKACMWPGFVLCGGVGILLFWVERCEWHGARCVAVIFCSLRQELAQTLRELNDMKRVSML